MRWSRGWDAAVANRFLPCFGALFHLKLSSLIFQSIDELLLETRCGTQGTGHSFPFRSKPGAKRNLKESTKGEAAGCAGGYIFVDDSIEKNQINHFFLSMISTSAKKKKEIRLLNGFMKFHLEKKVPHQQVHIPFKVPSLWLISAYVNLAKRSFLKCKGVKTSPLRF